MLMYNPLVYGSRELFQKDVSRKHEGITDVTLGRGVLRIGPFQRQMVLKTGPASER